jgi:hypothetical protein
LIEISGGHNEKNILHFLEKVRIKLTIKTFIFNRKKRWIL